MAPISLIYCARSDGVRRVGGESNGPTQAQFTKAKDKNGLTSFYREVPISDPKSFDWRKKLALFLMREAIPHQKKREGAAYDEEADPLEQYILADFPENYRLYEHRRVLNTNDAADKGRNDRRDCYLYGHPDGRKKRYRSPNDFARHLIWLMLDEKGDREACNCKLCTPDDIIRAGEEMALLQQASMGQKNTQRSNFAGKDVPTRATCAPPSRTLDAVRRDSIYGTSGSIGLKRTLPGNSHSQGQGPETKKVHSHAALPTASAPKQPPSKSQAPRPAPTPTMVPAESGPAPLVPATLAEPRSFEQAIDISSSKYLYRTGEVVWFQRGSAFGLAVITARDMRKVQGQDHAVYLVQPLSYPGYHPEPVVVTEESEIKPWLAYSAPPAMHEMLRNPSLKYENINWQGVLRGDYGEGNTEVDGSIFAAKAVDTSFTPIEPLPSNSPTALESRYNGIYIGGEKIWLGEAIRLRVGSGHDIMVLNHIIEPSGIQAFYVAGDIYTPTTIMSQPNGPLPRSTNMPSHVADDLTFRNRLSMARKSQLTYWRQTASQARLSITDVKGRWYESKRLLPIIDANFGEAMRNGDVGDAGTHLNGRGDSSPLMHNRMGVRKATRLDALGASVPATLVFGGRVPMPVSTPQPQMQQEMNIYAQSIEPDMNVAQENEEQGETDIAQFVDVDKMEEEGDYNQGFLPKLGSGG